MFRIARLRVGSGQLRRESPWSSAPPRTLKTSCRSGVSPDAVRWFGGLDRGRSRGSVQASQSGRMHTNRAADGCRMRGSKNGVSERGGEAKKVFARANRHLQAGRRLPDWIRQLGLLEAAWFLSAGPSLGSLFLLLYLLGNAALGCHRAQALAESKTALFMCSEQAHTH